MGCHTWFFRPTKRNEESVDYCAYSDKGYIDADGFYDTFRINNFLYDTLKSLEETLVFIEKHKKYITFLDNWEQDLIKFWKDNPDGIIEFG